MFSSLATQIRLQSDLSPYNITRSIDQAATRVRNIIVTNVPINKSDNQTILGLLKSSGVQVKREDIKRIGRLPAEKLNRSLTIPEFTLCDITSSFRRLKNQKAIGADRLASEHLKVILGTTTEFCLELTSSLVK
ncbi:hypothetical protein GJ496_003894 [Pomphorhynchus laevis]|nr:hypothetical protein GJ496_007863 [Pomphorhynchus laevis]KAI0990450.1 hypothetical protein GJ496_003894 [Pomphorhynchus laevis]